MAKGEAGRLSRIAEGVAARARELARDADRTDLRYLAGRASLYSGDAEEGLACFRSHLEKRPISYSARVGEAVCLARLQRDGEAEQAFADLGFDGDLSGSVDTAFQHLGSRELDTDDVIKEQMRGGDRRRSLMLCRLLPPRWRDEFEAWCYHELGRDALALKRAKKGAVAGELAAEIFLATGHLDEALEIFEALGRGPRTSWYHTRGDEQKSAGLVGCARVALQREDYTRAIRQADHALELDSSCPPALLVKLAALHELGLEAKAKALLGKIHRTHPNQRLRVDDVDLQELESDLGKAARTRHALDDGDAHFAGRRFDEAAAAYARAFPRAVKRLDSRRCEAGLRYAYALARVGQDRRAAQVAGWIANADAKNLTAHEIRCWALSRQPGEEAEARVRDLFVRCGLGIELHGHGHLPKRYDVAAWTALPVHLALRFQRVEFCERATELVHFGEWEAAARMFAFIELPADAAERFLAAYACSHLDQPEPAWQHLEPLLDARSDDSYYQQPIDPWTLALEVLAKLGRTEKLLEVHRTMTDIWKSSEQHDRFKVRSAVQVARFLADEHPERAMDLLEGVRGLAPEQRDVLEAFHDLALRLGSEGVPAEQLASSSDDPMYASRELQARAFAEDRNGWPERAVELYLDALECDPAADICGNAANILVKVGEHARARRFFDLGQFMVADMHPPIRRGWFYSKLAWHAHSSGQHARGAAVARTAVELTGASSNQHTLAACLLAMGEEDAARAAVASGLDLDPRDPDLNELANQLDS